MLWVRAPLRRGVLNATLCDKVCQWLVTGWWFSLGTLVFSTNKTDRLDITEILLKVALKNITPNLLKLCLVLECWHLCFEYLKICLAQQIGQLKNMIANMTPKQDVISILPKTNKKSHQTHKPRVCNSMLYT
jgi:hypothetical protein